MKTNYHTHTTRCHHARGTDEEYVLNAIKGGFKVLGFSDHTPWKYDTNFVPYMRMLVDEFKEYKESVLALKEKYKDIIDIKLGLECEYFHRYMPWLEKFIEEEEIDYIILGNHYWETDELKIYYGSKCNNNDLLKDYVRTCVEGMKTGLYAYLAHPDLYMRSREVWDHHCQWAADTICKAAKEHDFILEFNLAGLSMSREMGRHAYPHPEFWKTAAEYGCKAIIGVDAHDARALSNIELYEESRKTLEDLGLEIVEEIPMRK